MPVLFERGSAVLGDLAEDQNFSAVRVLEVVVGDQLEERMIARGVPFQIITENLDWGMCVGRARTP